MWYDDEIALNLYDALSGYRQEPYCGYDFSFNLKHEASPVNFPGSLTQLPAEAIYNSLDQIVYLQKCSAAGNPSIQDPECSGSPFEKQVTLVVIASLVGDPQNKLNIDIKFNFNIGDICVNDKICYVETVPDFLDYMIYDPAKSATNGPIFEQKYPLCPYSCFLTDQ